LNIVANAGQNLVVRVAAEVRGARRAGRGGMVQALAAMVLACVVFRLLLTPVIDLLASAPAAIVAARKVEHPTDPDRAAQFIKEQKEIRSLVRTGAQEEAFRTLAAKQGDLTKRLNTFKSFKSEAVEQAKSALDEAYKAMSVATSALEEKDAQKAFKAQLQAVQALEKARPVLTEHSPLYAAGGWLTLPWGTILSGSTQDLQASWFNSEPGTVPAQEYRHYFLSAFIRRFVAWTWWLGALWGLVLMWRRREGGADMAWGLLAGAAAGVAVSATLACVILLAEIVPHAVYHPAEPGVMHVAVWMLLALIYWAALGVILGVLSGVIAPLRRALVAPLQTALARVCRLCGLKGLAAYWAAA
jgi:hypothetical protein